MAQERENRDFERARQQEQEFDDLYAKSVQDNDFDPRDAL